MTKDYYPLFMRCGSNPGKCRKSLSSPEWNKKSRSRMRAMWAWVITLNHVSQKKLILNLYYGCICLAVPPVLWETNQPKIQHGIHDKLPHTFMHRNILCLETYWRHYFTGWNLGSLHSKGMTNNAVPHIDVYVYELNDNTSKGSTDILNLSGSLTCAYAPSNDACTGTQCGQLALTY